MKNIKEELRYYNANNYVVPEQYGKYCVKRTYNTSMVGGAFPIYKIEREAWLLEDPDNKTKFSNNKKLEEWKKRQAQAV